MDLKTYRGPNSRAVFQQVRAELGEDAVVLETREVRARGGARLVEVVAARDRDAVPPAPAPPRAVAPGRAARQPAAPRPAAAAVPGRAAPHSAAPQPAVDDLSFLSHVLDRSAVDRAAAMPFSGDGAQLYKRLVACAIRPSVARTLLRQAGPVSAQNLGTVVKRLIGRALVARLVPPPGSPRILALIGPTGVGKTTTAAKLAARLAKGRGRRVGLVAADPYRVGACEQLSIYADLLGAPARVAQRPGEVDRAIESLAGCDWILIDTQGRSPREALADARWQAYFASRPQIHPLLVLAANTREPDLDAAVDAFWATGPRGIVFTKVDESSALGSLVNQAVRTRLPVVCVTNGQNVPEDLLMTTPAAMTEMVLAGAAA